MGAISYFYSTPTCKAASNLPNLVDRIRFQAQTMGRLQARAAIPQFDKQQTSVKASTVAGLIDMPVLRSSTVLRAMTNQVFLTVPMSGSAQRATMKNGVLVVTAAGSGMAIKTDIYIDRIEWDNPLANDHRFVIRDGNEAVVAQGRANLENVGQVIPQQIHRRAIGGLQVTSLDSGTLTIYTGKQPRN